MPKSSDIRRIYRGELIGRYVEISASSDPSQKGLRGWIIDETKNTISLADDPLWKGFLDGPIPREDIKVIPKDHVKLKMYDDRIQVRPEIDGPGLEPVEINLGRMKVRPEDRNKKFRRMKI